MLITALRVTLFTLVLTGLIYPMAITGLSQLLFHHAANGSLVHDRAGQVIGSELIAQPFAAPSYFQPRPSSAGQNGYDATASSGSNYGVTSQKLHDRVAQERARLERENPDAPGAPPAELVTASGSGLDPHLSPEAARWQAPRIARARGVTADVVQAVIDANVEGRDLGFLGEPRVNVLLLNLALDRQLGAARGL
ncbi:MAG TPA: potassium-transporting ATPase subunit KdpC [Polyangia bacterium]|nr:potassium-transporting ATPase subunit KdpC [Polyangia bacterium]